MIRKLFNILNNLKLLLRERIFLYGLCVRSFAYIILFFHFNFPLKTMFIALGIEILHLLLVSSLITNKRYEVILYIWLNPIYFALAIYLPDSMLISTLLFLGYLSAIKLRNNYLMALPILASFAHPSYLLFTSISLYLLNLGNIKSIFTRYLLLFLIYICVEILFSSSLGIFNEYGLAYRLIFIILFLISGKERHISFEKINLIIFLISTYFLIFLNEIYLMPILLASYFFSTKENLTGNQFSKLTLNIILLTFLFTDILSIQPISEFMSQNAVVFISLILLISLDSINNIKLKNNIFLSILISGDSGVGKDRFAEKLITLLGKNYTNHISGDDFHKYERGSNAWNFLTHLNPSANFVKSKEEKLKKLIEGKSIFHRHYDHKTGKFSNIFKLKPKLNLIASGLHSQYIKLEAIRIHLSMEKHLNKYFKIKRDFLERKKNIQEAINQFNSRRNDAEMFIDKQSELADLHLKLIHTSSDVVENKINKILTSNNPEQLFNDDSPILESLGWQIFSKDKVFLSKLFEDLIIFNEDNIINISYEDDSFLFINDDCKIPSMSHIVQKNYQASIHDYFINPFDSFTNHESKMDVQCFIILKYYLHKEGNNND